MSFPADIVTSGNAIDLYLKLQERPIISQSHQVNYMQYIRDIDRNGKVGTPIFDEDICRRLSRRFDLVSTSPKTVLWPVNEILNSQWFTALVVRILVPAEHSSSTTLQPRTWTRLTLLCRALSLGNRVNHISDMRTEAKL